MEFTGERMVPAKADDATFWEHILRYSFAKHHIRAGQILDVACGEGYGTYALGQIPGVTVIGLDVSPETCRHASERYGIDARVADAQSMPIADQSIDSIVSFETIEHLSHPELFLSECYRVLRPGGAIVISTPERRVYGQKGNPYHSNEMSFHEFSELMAERFTDLNWFFQCGVEIGGPSLRSLSMGHSLWTKVRGFTRLRNLLCKWIGRGARSYRETPERCILDDAPWLDRLLNPYVVRRMRDPENDLAEYIICVGKRSREVCSEANDSRREARA